MKIKETKEKILDSLEGKYFLKCPLCNHSVFIRKTYTKVEVSDDGETIKDEEIKFLEDETIYICAKCDADLTEEELVR